MTRPRFSAPIARMKRFPRLCFLLLTLVFTVAARAETPEERAKRVTVTMNLNDVPASAAAHFIQVVSNVKVHYEGAAADKTVLSVNFENTPAHDAFAYLAELAKLQLTYKEDGAHLGPKK